MAEKRVQSIFQKSLFCLSLILGVQLIIPSVFAAVPGPGDAIVMIVNLITQFFGFEWLTGFGENATVAFVRFLIFIFIARLFYAGISTALSGRIDNKTAVISSIILALLGTVGIPKEILISIIAIYSTVVSVFLICIVFYGLYWLHNKFPPTSTLNIILRIIILALIIIGSGALAVMIATG